MRPKELNWSGRFVEHKPKTSEKPEPIFLHMEGGDFKPLYMPKNSYSKRNEINLAVPPGTNVRFFLTHGGLLKISKNYDVVELTNRVTTELQFTEEFSKEVRTMVM